MDLPAKLGEGLITPTNLVSPAVQYFLASWIPWLLFILTGQSLRTPRDRMEQKQLLRRVLDVECLISDRSLIVSITMRN
ncbi:hypothetical protein SCP_1303310 [Sparassis crispa]|uniref:Uncharacterized protein n=1 Tax=Sparassis crispa TaxID=139825 RepID=A0A401H257_9APHY|nr:hypothetical protein SCP_1303310 [Sparassis crispa]GBE88515.1 hypothetical protein SCP_1303310 [Sparassis crispa]